MNNAHRNEQVEFKIKSK